jgi:hypothetical protein
MPADSQSYTCTNADSHADANPASEGSAHRDNYRSRIVAGIY